MVMRLDICDVGDVATVNVDVDSIGCISDCYGGCDIGVVDVGGVVCVFVGDGVGNAPTILRVPRHTAVLFFV